jgi:dihydrofolate synthase/folylpolyglutamate synthase
MVRMPHWPIPMGNKPIDLDLSRIKLLLNALGNPQNKLPPIIHVAGTNGKGSTTAFLKAIFQTAGYKVHCYNSPHLIRFNERITILGDEIEDQFLYETLEECRIAEEKEQIKLTFFEGTTAAAFLAFSKVKADVIILEVGLGGRLDATNVISQPAMSIITSIDLDHIDFLGDTLVKIAYEKAGIIKPNFPCVIAPQYPEVMELLLNLAEKNNSTSYAYEYDWVINPGEDKNFIYNSPEKTLTLPAPSLQGAHQYINAGNAITAVLQLKEFNISDKDIEIALTRAVWPARLQRLKEGYILQHLPKEWQIWVDGAHNDAGAHVLSTWLDEQEIIPTYMIFGMTKGRNCQSFLNNFVGKIEYLVGVSIEAEPSSYSGTFVSNEATKIGISSTGCGSIEEALDILTKMEKNQARIIVCGSLYLAGDILYQNQKRRT